jgi:hypothetical protein
MVSFSSRDYRCIFL